MAKIAKRVAGGVKLASMPVIAAAVIVLARGLPIGGGVEALRRWVESLGAWGPVAFGPVYANDVAHRRPR